MKKIFAFDLDGTILNNDAKISDKTYATLQKLHNEGNIICYASGRCVEGILEVLQEREIIGDYFVASNGTIIYDFKNKTILNSTFFDENIILYLLNSKYFSRIVLFYPINCLSIEPNQDIQIDTKNVSKINYYIKDEYDIVEVIKEFEPKFPDCAFVNTKHSFKDKYWIEIAPNKYNKFKGIQYLSNNLNIPIENCVAFGDTGIDIEMIENCGIGVAMENAEDRIKKYADFVCESNVDDGVAKFIEEHFFNKKEN